MLTELNGHAANSPLCLGLTETCLDTTHLHGSRRMQWLLARRDRTSVVAFFPEAARDKLRPAGKWEGRGEWRGLVFLISFTISEDDLSVAGLDFGWACSGPQSPKTPADLAVHARGPLPTVAIRDGQFSIDFGPGGILSGRFLSNAVARGGFRSSLSLACGDAHDVVLQASGEWEARKQQGP